MKERGRYSERFKLKHFWRVIYSRLAFILFVSLTTGLASYYLIDILIEPSYRSSAVLIVDTENIYQAQVYEILLRSEAIMEPISSLLPNGEDLDTMGDRISVSFVGTTEILEVSVLAEDPYQAKRILDEIIVHAPDVFVNMKGVDDITVVSKAQLQLNPVGPSIAILSIGGFGVGMLLSLVYVILRYTHNKKILSPKELGHDLDALVIGIIPNYDCVKGSVK